VTYKVSDTHLFDNMAMTLRLLRVTTVCELYSSAAARNRRSACLRSHLSAGEWGHLHTSHVQDDRSPGLWEGPGQGGHLELGD
jgi:hypothetical protein